MYGKSTDLPAPRDAENVNDHGPQRIGGRSLHFSLENPSSPAVPSRASYCIR